MTKLHLSIDEVQHAEKDLARELRVIAERHAAEHDVYHLGHSLARHCVDRVARLRPFVDRYGAHDIDVDEAAAGHRFTDALRRTAGELVADIDVVGVALLKDLRNTYLAAHRVEIEWTILLQAARAVRDGELITVVTSCHEQAEHTAKWLRTRIKQGAAQVIATS